MALEKVLALDATGVIEKTIDTGGGGGGSGSGGSIIKHTIDLTNGQTAVVVPGGYTSAGIAVYLNGAYLSPAEYTATTSPNITLAVGAPSEDSVLDVLVFEVGATTGGPVTEFTGDCNDLVTGGPYNVTNASTNKPVAGTGGWFIEVLYRSGSQVMQRGTPNDFSLLATLPTVPQLVRWRASDLVTWSAWTPVGDGGGGGLTDAPSDTKLYGRKDAAWVEVPAGGDDGVTLANICDLAMDGRTLISDMCPFYTKYGIGVAQLLTGALTGTATPIYGNDTYTNSISGTSAFTAIGAGVIQCISGTTAAGYATYRQGIGCSFSSPAYSPYTTLTSVTTVDQKMAASAVVYVSALSDATNTYTASVTLMGEGPNTNAAPGINDKGFTLTYTDSVNSGNWVITYRGVDNLLKTINTSVPPATALASAMRFVAKAHRTSPTTATVTIDLGGTVYTITDARFNDSNVYANAVVAGRIIKSLGTTSRTLYMRQPSVARNLAP